MGTEFLLREGAAGSGAQRLEREKEANVPAAKEAFFLRAKLNGAAQHGNYSQSMEADRLVVPFSKIR